VWNTQARRSKVYMLYVATHRMVDSCPQNLWYLILQLHRHHLPFNDRINQTVTDLSCVIFPSSCILDEDFTPKLVSSSPVACPRQLYDSCTNQSSKNQKVDASQSAGALFHMMIHSERDQTKAGCSGLQTSPSCVENLCPTRSRTSSKVVCHYSHPTLIYYLSGRCRHSHRFDRT
jgi:hypothetical protein